MVSGTTMVRMADATYRRHDGAQLVLIGRRLSERPSPVGAWRLVRIVEGTRAARVRAAGLWARTHGYEPAREQATGPVAVVDHEAREEPRGECVRVVAMPWGAPRIPLDVAREGGRFWCRRHDSRWIADEHLGTAIGLAIGQEPESRTVLECAVRALKRLDMAAPS